MISFNRLPANILTPGAYAELDYSQLNNGQDKPPMRVVLLGYKISAGTKAVNTLNKVSSPSQAITYFGRGSMLARMCQKFLENCETVELFAVPMAEPSAGGDAAATGTIAISGTATAGTIPLYIGGQSVPVTVTAAQANNSIAAAINAAINANLDLPVTSTVSTNTVTLTARHKGTHGAAIGIRVGYKEGEAAPSGVTVTIGGLAGAVGPFDITDALTALGDEPFAAIVSGWGDGSPAAMATFLDARADPMVQLDGLGFVTWNGTHSGMLSLGNSLNSEFICGLALSGSPSPNWEHAAATVGAAYREAIKDPARHFEGLEVKGILAPPANARFTRQERQYQLEAGVSSFTTDREGRMRIETLVTTRKTDSSGVALPGLKLINAMLILFAMRWEWNRRIRTKFPRHKLANDGTRFAAGQPVMTPKVAKAEALAIGRAWEAKGWLEDYATFKATVVCERDADNLNQLNMVLPPNLINSFLVMATLIQPRA